MRDERKKQARSNKQTRQRNTALPRQSLFLITCYALRMYIIMYVGLRVPSTVPKEFNIGILNVQMGLFVIVRMYMYFPPSLPPSLLPCTFRQKIGNFKTEPPGLFRGRGDHPKQGRIKVTNEMSVFVHVYSHA